MSRIYLPDSSKLAINWKNVNDVTIFRHNFIVNFFGRFFASLVKFNLVTVPSFTSISSLVLELWQFPLIRVLQEIQKSEIPPSKFCQYIWRLEQVRDTTFGTNVSNKMLLNAAKYQGYSFYRFWVIEGKPTGGRGVKLPPPTNQIRVNSENDQTSFG